jgi:hypothetical protein
MADEYRVLARRLAAARARPTADLGADTINYIEVAALELDLLQELPREPLGKRPPPLPGSRARCAPTLWPPTFC